MRPSRANSAPVMSPAKEQSQHSPSASPRRTQGEHGTLNKTYLKLGCSYIARGHLAAQRSMLSMTQGSVMLGTARHVLGGSPAYDTACSDSSPEKPGHAVAARSHSSCRSGEQTRLPDIKPHNRPALRLQALMPPACTGALRSSLRRGTVLPRRPLPLLCLQQRRLRCSPTPRPLYQGCPLPAPCGGVHVRSRRLHSLATLQRRLLLTWQCKPSLAWWTPSAAAPWWQVSLREPACPNASCCCRCLQKPHCGNWSA